MNRAEYLDLREQYALATKHSPRPRALKSVGQPPRKEPIMGAAAEREEQTSTEYQRPNAAAAFDIYDKQIKPKLVRIDTARGELSQPWQDIKEHAHFPRPVMNFLINLENIEDDEKRDHYLLALAGGLQHRKLFLPRDLVTMADGNEGGPIVPTGERPGLRLATDNDADDFEASEDELAAQRDRPGQDFSDEDQAEAAE